MHYFFHVECTYAKFGVQFLSPPKPAGLDPQIFAGIPQIGCEKPIAKKSLKKKFHRKFSKFVFLKKNLVNFFLVNFFYEIAERSVAISE
jgi:hypothetical protein